MSARTVMMGEMTWPEYAEALERDPVVFLPTGALEQHGPHLPMGVDCLPPDDAAVEAPPHDVWPPRRERVAASGSLVSATGASATQGAAIAAQYQRDIAAAVRLEFEPED